MKYRIAAVSYINTLPFLHGLQHPEVRELIDVTLAHPARCAELLQKGEVDIALCPVGALTSMDRYHVITDYCIGCDGPVRTVSIYSDKPLSELTHIVLSPESRTSNLLVQIINKEYWRHPIIFSSTSTITSEGRTHRSAATSPVSSISTISSTSSSSVGFLFIGDICFAKEKEFAFRTDLGQAWKEWTGLPFAFACWVSRKNIDEDVVQQINTAFESGIQDIDKLTFPGGVDSEVMREYLKKNISYEFDTGKKEAMEKYLDLIGYLQ
jgi:chorismate dehydratase